VCSIGIRRSKVVDAGGFELGNLVEDGGQVVGAYLRQAPPYLPTGVREAAMIAASRIGEAPADRVAAILGFHPSRQPQMVESRQDGGQSGLPHIRIRIVAESSDDDLVGVRGPDRKPGDGETDPFEAACVGRVEALEGSGVRPSMPRDQQLERERRDSLQGIKVFAEGIRGVAPLDERTTGRVGEVGADQPPSASFVEDELIW